MCVILNEGNSLVQTPREWQRCDLNPESLPGGRGCAVAACALCSVTAGVAGLSCLLPSCREGSSIKGLEWAGSQGFTYSASVRGHPSCLLAKEGHLPHSTSRSREGDPVVWLETYRKCLGAAPVTPHLDTPPSFQPLTSAETLPRWQIPHSSPVPHFLLSQTTSPCLAEKRKSKTFVLYYGN